MKKGVDFTGVTIVYICHDGEGNYLFQKRSTVCRDEHDRWDIGGGGLDFGDTVEKTLQKEIKEEYCTEVLSSEFLGYRDVHRVHNGQNTHWVALDFKVQVNREVVQNGEPHKFSEIGWFKKGHFPTPQHSQLSVFFTQYEDKLFVGERKTIKFAPHLVASLRDGSKTTTWRLFDDKDLSVGDEVSFVNKESLETVGTARIVSVCTKPLADVTHEELAEHGYADSDAMYENLFLYYGDRVTPDTEIKMITFSGVTCT